MSREAIKFLNLEAIETVKILVNKLKQMFQRIRADVST